MLEVKIHIDGNLLADLDTLDKDVLAAVKEAVHLTADEAYRRMLHWSNKYDWKPPRTTGNLVNTMGFLVQGGGKYNIFNYNATRSLKKTNDNAPLPSAPNNPFSAIVFALASYAAFQEFGTVHHGARPFFYRSINKASEKMEFNLLTALRRRGRA